LDFPSARVLQRVSLAPLDVRILEESRANGFRHLKLSIRSTTDSPEFAIFVESENSVMTAELNGAQLGEGELKQVGFKSSVDEGSDGRVTPQLSVRCYGFSREPATLVLETKEGAALRLHVFGRSYERPVIPSFQIRSHSSGFEEARFGDGTIAYRSFTL
jgi:hypothetical protein